MKNISFFVKGKSGMYMYEEFSKCKMPTFCEQKWMKLMLNF